MALPDKTAQAGQAEPKPRTGGEANRRPRVDGSPAEKWPIMQESPESDNVWEIRCRYGAAATLYYRRKDET